MESFLALHEFVESWRGMPSFVVDSCGSCTFEGEILYEFQGTHISDYAPVKITRNGYEEGKVTLTESGELHSDRLHLDFSPNFQTYSFDSSSRALVISGNSKKMSGNYIVIVKPVT